MARKQLSRRAEAKPIMTTDLSTLLTVQQAARKSEYVSEGALRARIKTGELPVVRLGSSLFIEANELENWLKRRGVRG